MAMSKGFRIYEKSKPPSPYSILMEHRSRPSETLLFESQAVAILSIQETDIIRKQYTKIHDAYGCLGVLRLNFAENNVLYLILVTGCFSVGKIGDIEIFRITQTQFISLQFQQSTNDEKINEVRKVLNSGTFYFAWDPNNINNNNFNFNVNNNNNNSSSSSSSISSSISSNINNSINCDININYKQNQQQLPFDLTLCAQRRSMTNEIDNRFFWNRMLHMHLLRYGIDCQFWLLKIICGSIEIRTIYVGSRVARVAIISRLSCERAGTRFNLRGTNDDGYVGNFIETEQVIYLDTECTSYVQVRGSVPIYWEQPGVQVGSHKVKLSRGFEASTVTFDRHMNLLKKHYGQFAIVNLLGSSLIGNKEGEAMLNNEFQRHHKESQLHCDIPHILFDYHQECRGTNNNNTIQTVLQTKLKNRLEQFGCISNYDIFYINTTQLINYANNNEMNLRQQRGTIRSNCLDCCERTNTVQTFIGLEILAVQIQVLGLSNKKQMCSRFEEIFRQMWLNNGAEINKIYICTGILQQSGGGGGGGGGSGSSISLGSSNISSSGSSGGGGGNSNSSINNNVGISGSSLGGNNISSSTNKLIDGARMAVANRTLFQSSSNFMMDNLRQESIDILLMGSTLCSELSDRARQLLPTNMLHVQTPILRELCRRYLEYCNMKELRVACGTYNVNGGKHFRSVAYKDLSLTDWLLDSQRLSKSTLIDISNPEDGDDDDDADDDDDDDADADDDDYIGMGDNCNGGYKNNNNNNKKRKYKSADIYAIGFQEIVDLNASNIMAASTENTKLWALELQKTLSRNEPYYLLTYQQLVGVCLYIFIRPKLIPFIRDIGIDTVKTGFGGAAGNKGAVAIRFIVYSSSICFVCAHFAAGQQQVTERNADYAEITRKIQFPMGRSLRSHDYVFWCGDFNYRVDGYNESNGGHELKELIKQQEYDKILRTDQLKVQQQLGLVFNDYQEGYIDFAPTYKYDLFSNDYDTSDKCRLPAWTDRILWRRRKPFTDNIEAIAKVDGGGWQHGKLIHYGRCELKQSDHRPVIAIVDIDFIECNLDKRNYVFQQVIMDMGPSDGTIIISIDNSYNQEQFINDNQQLKQRRQQQQHEKKKYEYDTDDADADDDDDDDVDNDAGADDDNDDDADDEDDDDDNINNKIYDENLMNALIHELTQIGEIILVRYVDETMLITFRNGQAALMANEKQSLIVCGIKLLIKLKVQNWLIDVENEIKLCTSNTIKLYDNKCAEQQQQQPKQQRRQIARYAQQQQQFQAPPIPPQKQHQQYQIDYNCLGIPSCIQTKTLNQPLRVQQQVPTQIDLLPPSIATRPPSSFSNSSFYLPIQQDTIAIYEEINDDIKNNNNSNCLINTDNNELPLALGTVPLIPLQLTQLQKQQHQQQQQPSVPLPPPLSQQQQITSTAATATSINTTLQHYDLDVNVLPPPLPLRRRGIGPPPIPARIGILPPPLPARPKNQMQ